MTSRLSIAARVARVEEGLERGYADKARDCFRTYCQESIHYVPSELKTKPGAIKWGRRYAVDGMDGRTSNWYLDAIADHAEAWARGEFRFLLVNIRNKAWKSGMCVVDLPTWLWIPRSPDDPLHMGPRRQILTGGHAQDLAIEQCRQSRDVLKSDWWGRWFGEGAKSKDRRDWSWWQWSDDQDAKGFYNNKLGGHRVAVWPPAGTGKMADDAIVDDSLGINQSYSEAHNTRSNDWVFGTIWSRFNDPSTGRLMNIQHRLRPDDTSGEFSRRFGYWFQGDGEVVCLNLPLEYKPRMWLPNSAPKVRMEDVPPTPIGWKDPRTEEGEALEPSRWTPDVIRQDKKAFGDLYEALCNQNPQGRGDRVIKPHWKWWVQWETRPDPRKGHIVQSWDCGFKGLDPTKPKADAKAQKRSLTVGWVVQIIGGRAYLLDRYGGVPMGTEEQIETFRRAMRDWPRTVRAYVEDKAGGSFLIQQLLNEFPAIKPVDPDRKGGKWQRFSAVANVYLKDGQLFFPPDSEGPWVQEVKAYLEGFPGADFDDDPDVCSQLLSEEWLPDISEDAMEQATARRNLGAIFSSYSGRR